MVDSMTWFALDYEVLSNFCIGCEPENYAELWEDHEHDFMKNHEGTSVAIELAAALKIWER